ncbi:MAG: hypothetical protein L0Y58_07005 [Verrucomicrobia subdivision 3 bacterium]|nr:hypothetical protein [Limisphaerales bacterium]
MPSSSRHRLTIAALLIGVGVLAAEPVSFVRDIAPVLRDKCLTCHGAEKAKGNYRLDSFELLAQSGSSEEPPITPGAPEKSHLLELLSARDADDRMPQKDDALPGATIALFERWIREGARFDGPNPKATLVSLAGLLTQPMPPENYAAPVPITALALHPNGEELAASGYHEITIWSTTSGDLLRRVTNVAQRTMALAYNHDGSRLAVASGTPGRHGEAKLFDTKTGVMVHTLATTPDPMLAIAFSSDSKRVACAGADNAIRVFNTTTGQPELTIEQHADWVTGVAFSPDAAHVVSASRDKTARVFDAATGELESTYTGHGEPLFAIAFRGDGKHVLSGGRDKKVHVWEPKEAKKISEITGFDDEVYRIVSGTNGIFVAGGKRVRQYREDAKQESIRAFNGHRDLVYSVALHEASNELATGSFDGEVRLWRVADGGLIRSFKAIPGRNVAQLSR